MSERICSHKNREKGCPECDGPDVTEREKLSEKIHQIYCSQYEKKNGKEYWTQGAYTLLDEETKDFDRAIADFIIADRKRITDPLVSAIGRPHFSIDRLEMAIRDVLKNAGIILILLLIASPSFASPGGMNLAMTSGNFKPAKVPVFTSTARAEAWAGHYIGNPYVKAELRRLIDETSDAITAILIADGEPMETLEKAAELSKLNQRYRKAFNIVDAAMNGSTVYMGSEPYRGDK